MPLQCTGNFLVQGKDDLGCVMRKGPQCPSGVVVKKNSEKNLKNLIFLLFSEWRTGGIPPPVAGIAS